MTPIFRLAFCPVLLALALLTASPATAEPLGKTVGKIKEIRVTGLQRYSQQEVLAVIGLAAGQDISEDDLKDATTQLGRTGAFSDLAYSYSTLAGAVKVEWQLTEIDKLLDVRFDNFVWWTDGELSGMLRARVPLFRNQLPVAGSLPDAVADALQAIISERQLPGHVIYDRYAQENGPLEAFIYHLENLSIRTVAMDFPGSAPDELPALQDAARKQLLGKQYSAAQVSTIASHDFRDIYLRRGYLQVEFGGPTATAPQSAKREPAQGPSTADEHPSDDDPNSVAVTVHLPVQPGLQFRLASVDWTGNHVFSVGELQKFITTPTGGVANLPRLREDIDQASKLYGRRGYMNLKYKLESHIETATQTASFTVRIAEGDVYHFGELSIDGLDTKTEARVRDHWSLRQGEPFDIGYQLNFIQETQRLLPPGRWTSVEDHLNEAEKTVDVALRYVPTTSN